MTEELRSLWERRHSDPAGARELPEALRERWIFCAQAGIGGRVKFGPPPDAASLDALKRRTRRLYSYSDPMLQKLSSALLSDELGFCLFDAEGNLLKLYGGAPFLSFCAAHGIRRGQAWTCGSVGANAVTAGLTHMAALVSSGADNSALELTDCALYFAPITTDHGQARQSLYGGICILAPLDRQDPYLLPLTIAAARERALQLFWYHYSSQLHDSGIDGQGLITVEQSTGRNRIIEITRSMSQLLELPSQDRFWSELEDIVDPPPANRAFWSVVNRRTDVTDRNIRLTAGGKEYRFSITTRPFREDNLRISGICIRFNTFEHINNLLSKYTGNIARYTFSDIVVEDRRYRKILDASKTVAGSESNLLLLGESGVGKDILAQAIHNSSPRRNGPFVAINCAAFSRELISSELFGYEEGAFTGAKRGGNIGKFELATNGTIFLDEIGDMPLDLQAILLRVIEQRNFTKLGGSAVTPVDTRIIAATNSDLWDRVQKKLFREDLYYRLGTVKIRIPPLRERPADILPLAAHFIGVICTQLGRPEVALSGDAEEFLLSYRWPGNVRELRNLLEGLIQCSPSPVVGREEIVQYLGADGRVSSPPPNDSPACGYRERLRLTRMQAEREECARIADALVQASGNRTRAAELLGISRRTLYRRLSYFGLDKA